MQVKIRGISNNATSPEASTDKILSIQSFDSKIDGPPYFLILMEN
ncbi:MAG: hypothetical protein ACTSPQ_20265 [Candidatus Helarchaeota archaeon]